MDLSVNSPFVFSQCIGNVIPVTRFLVSLHSFQREGHDRKNGFNTSKALILKISSLVQKNYKKELFKRIF